MRKIITKTEIKKKKEFLPTNRNRFSQAVSDVQLIFSNLLQRYAIHQNLYNYTLIHC